MEPNTNPSDFKQQFQLQIPKSSYYEIFTDQKHTPSSELQQQFSDVFGLEQTQTEKECSRLQHQTRIEAENLLLQ